MTSFKRIWEPLAEEPSAAANQEGQTGFAFRPLWRGTKPQFLTVDKVLDLPEQPEPDAAIVDEKNADVPVQELVPDAAAPVSPAEIGVAAADPVEQAVTPEREITPAALPQIEAPAAVEQSTQVALEAGKAEGLAEAEAALASERAELRALIAALENTLERPENFFQPLKRLALHIAGAVVRVELESRADIIEQTIAGCLAEIDETAVVRLRLNPADAELLRQSESAQRLEILADEKLSRGSVKVELTEGWIEDLIEERWRTVRAALKVEP